MGSVARVSYGLTPIYGLTPKVNPLVLKQAHTLHTPICPLTIPGMHAKKFTSKRRARAALIMLRAYVNPQTGDLESASLTVVPSGLCLINYGFSNLQTCGRLPYIKTLPSPTPFISSATLYTTIIYVRCWARYVTNGPISLSGCISKVPCFAYWLSGALPFQGKMQVYCVNCSMMSCISCTAIRLLCSPCCQLPTPQIFAPKPDLLLLAYEPPQMFATTPCKKHMVDATLVCALDLASPVIQASNSSENGDVPGFGALHTITALQVSLLTTNWMWLFCCPALNCLDSVLCEKAMLLVFSRIDHFICFNSQQCGERFHSSFRNCKMTLSSGFFSFCNKLLYCLRNYTGTNVR